MGRIGILTFAQVSEKLDLVSVEMTRNVQLLAEVNSNIATLQKVFNGNEDQASN